MHQVVFLEITAKLVVVDALLETNKYIIELQVELGTLLKENLELVLDDQSLINLLKELVFGGVVSNRVNNLLHSWSCLLYLHCYGLLLLFESFILCEVLGVFGLVALENFSFVSTATVDLHQLFDSLQVVVHGDTLLHNLFLLLSDLLELVKSSLDSYDSGVLINILGLSL